MNNNQVQMIVPPTGYLVTNAELVVACKVDEQSDLPYIDALNAAATAWVEKTTGRAFLNRTYKMFFDCWPGQAESEEWWDGERVGALATLSTPRRWFELPYGPIFSVTHIKTYDDADNASTFSSSSYIVDNNVVPGRIALRSDASWPVPTKLTNGIEIQWVAGYGATIASLPQALADVRVAIMQIVAHWYESRQPVVTGTITAEVPMTAARLIKGLKVIRL